MQCPNDQTTLAMMERQGIEIDYCPTCRGVWLDRGELDKLISANGNQNVPQQPAPPQHYEERRDNYQQPHPQYNDDYKYHKKHRKESFLGDLFDF